MAASSYSSPPSAPARRATPPVPSAAKPSVVKKSHDRAPHEVRLIAGDWKRTKLPVLDLPGLRPTPSRVRATLFNWLGQDLSGWRCLDAFAGTGALGLEAASRGAAEVLLIEQHPALVHARRSLIERLPAPQVQVQRAEALAVLRTMPIQRWDVVFLDPPFLAGENEALFQAALASARRCIAPQGWLHLEAPRAWTSHELAALGWRIWRVGKAGAVHHHLLQPDDIR